MIPKVPSKGFESGNNEEVYHGAQNVLYQNK